MSMETKQYLKRECETRGLHFLGIVPLRVEKDYQRYLSWLEEGNGEGMPYLRKHLELRADPSQLLPGASSAIIVGKPYDLGDRKEGEVPRVAQYARLEDYHRSLLKNLTELAGCLPGKSRVIVDTAPVLERALAAQCSTGFIGKNTCFIHPTHGSFLLLGEILNDSPLEKDERLGPELYPQKTTLGGCGPCRLCQDVCPTGALDKDYSIDSRKCIAYWTIEHRGEIPLEYWPFLKDYYFGCDLCQIVCPYNHPRVKRTAEVEKKYPDLFQVATMSQNEYESYFSKTPLTRAKRNGLRRNALIAMHVIEHPQMHEALQRAERDAEEPVGGTIRMIRQQRGGIL